MQKTVAVICARMGSERFPGKMLKQARGKPLIGHLIGRVRLARTPNDVVVATPDTRENDPIADYCASEQIRCFRGSEEDVAGRMLGALAGEHADIGVEVYGDSPLIDPALIDECARTFLENEVEWVGNDVHPVYPSGMYCEAFAVAAFQDSCNRNDDAAIREHGTLYIRQHPELYRQHHIAYEGPLKRTDIHLDIDTPEDFALFEAILDHFAPRNDFSLAEIIAFLDAHPDIARGNANVHRRWKQYQKS